MNNVVEKLSNIIIFTILISSVYNQNSNTYMVNINSNSDLKERWNSEIDCDYILKYIYPDIVLISRGPWFSALENYYPDDRGYFDYYYRCIYTFSEESAILFLEKYGTKSTDGLIVDLVNQTWLSLSAITQNNDWRDYGFIVDSINWINPNTFEAKIESQGDKEVYIFRITED